MNECKSSCISAHGYDAASKTLALTFKGGKTYRYADVPPSAYDALREAKSAGTYFAKHINGKFKGVSS